MLLFASASTQSDINLHLPSISFTIMHVHLVSEFSFFTVTIAHSIRLCIKAPASTLFSWRWPYHLKTPAAQLSKSNRAACNPSTTTVKVNGKMCQLCGIKEIAARDRWPKPLEHHKGDIDFLVTCANDEYLAFQTKKQIAKDASLPDALLEILRLLAALLDKVESDREKWWSSSEKREQRKRLGEDCDQKKLSELHKINNGVIERVEAMNAKLGLVVKWSLGMNGGVWELQQGGKVASAAK